MFVAFLTLLPDVMRARTRYLATVMPLASIAVSLTLGVWLMRAEQCGCHGADRLRRGTGVLAAF